VGVCVPQNLSQAFESCHPPAQSAQAAESHRQNYPSTTDPRADTSSSARIGPASALRLRQKPASGPFHHFGQRWGPAALAARCQRRDGGRISASPHGEPLPPPPLLPRAPHTAPGARTRPRGEGPAGAPSAPLG